MKVHFIKKTEDSYVMFLCESLRFFTVSTVVKELAQDILNGVPKEESLQKFNAAGEAYDRLKETLYSAPVEEVTKKSEDSLYKLTLNVTNKCNLNCKYCYANGGNYCSAEGMMDIATAKAAIDLFYSKYKRISFIQFFGGEPLLNEETIRFACQYITELHEAGRIDTLPKFGTISNGTIYSEKLAETINKYDISLTFSIDGPEQIHNGMRVYKDGVGSFQNVKDCIEKYAKHKIKPNMVEATYNSCHEANGYSVIDTIKFIKDEMGIANIHITPVSGDENYNLQSRDSFVDSVEESFREMSENKKDYSYSFIQRIVRALKTRRANKYHCEAGISEFSVSCRGDVYPCFMFTDIEEFCMGNVFDSTPVFDNPKFMKLQDSFESFNKYEYAKCKDCFNNRICFGCLGSNYFNCNDIFCTSDDDCEMEKRMTEKVLIALSDLA